MWRSEGRLTCTWISNQIQKNISLKQMPWALWHSGSNIKCCPSYFLSKFITSLIYNQEWLLECSDCEICDVTLWPVKEEDSVTTFAQLWYPKSQFFFHWRWNTHKGSAQFFQWKESELIKFLFTSYSLCSWKMRKNIYVE